MAILARLRQFFWVVISGVRAGVRSMADDARAAVRGPRLPPIPRKWRTPLELAALAVAILPIAYPVIVGLGPNNLSGWEHQRLSGIIIPVREALLERGELAMWNPYLLHGEPLMGNPFNYLWNPLASVPVLALGPTLGTRWALALHLFAAGVGAWLWGKSARLGWLARLFCGAIYAVSGGMIGKFAIGHFQLGLSLAWIPWALAGFQFSTRADIRANPRAFRRAIILMAAGAALTFLSGNIFYALPLAVSLGIAGLAYLFARDPERGGRLRLDRHTLISLLAGAALAVGLSAVLLFPVWARRDLIGAHSDDLSEEGSQTMAQGFANYLISDAAVYKSRLMGLTPWMGDSYSYMGLIPVALMALAPAAALARRERRASAILMFGLLILMLAWAGKSHTEIGLVYPLLPWLRQWRFLGRFLAMGNVYIAFLSGLGVQFLLDRFDAFNPPLIESPPGLGRAARNLLITLGLAVALGAGVAEAGLSNATLLDSELGAPSVTLDRVMGLLAVARPQPAYVWIDHTYDRYTYSTYLNHIYQVNLGEGWAPMPLPSDISANLVGPDVAYQIMRVGVDPPFPSVAQLDSPSEDIDIYDVADSIPFAFVVARRNLAAARVGADKLLAVQPVDVSANEMRFLIDMSGNEPGLLVVNVVAYPGWRVEIDEQPAPLTVVNTSLAVRLKRGQHTYVFRYVDVEFIVGLVVTALTFLACVAAWRWPNPRELPIASEDTNMGQSR